MILWHILYKAVNRGWLEIPTVLRPSIKELESSSEFHSSSSWRIGHSSRWKNHNLRRICFWIRPDGSYRAVRHPDRLLVRVCEVWNINYEYHTARYSYVFKANNRLDWKNLHFGMVPSLFSASSKPRCRPTTKVTFCSAVELERVRDIITEIHVNVT